MAEEKKMELSQEQAIGLLQNERRKMNALQEQFLQLRNSLEETIRAKETIENMQKAEDNESIMIPLGAGVYATGKLTENKTVHITLGGGVIKADSAANALIQLNNRQKEAETELKKIQLQIEETNTNVNGLTQALQNRQRQQAGQSSTGPLTSSTN